MFCLAIFSFLLSYLGQVHGTCLLPQPIAPARYITEDVLKQTDTGELYLNANVKVSIIANVTLGNVNGAMKLDCNGTKAMITHNSLDFIMLVEINKFTCDDKTARWKTEYGVLLPADITMTCLSLVQVGGGNPTEGCTTSLDDGERILKGDMLKLICPSGKHLLGVHKGIEYSGTYMYCYEGLNIERGKAISNLSCVDEPTPVCPIPAPISPVVYKRFVDAYKEPHNVTKPALLSSNGRVRFECFLDVMLYHEDTDIFLATADVLYCNKKSLRWESKNGTFVAPENIQSTCMDTISIAYYNQLCWTFMDGFRFVPVKYECPGRAKMLTYGQEFVTDWEHETGSVRSYNVTGNLLECSINKSNWTERLLNVDGKPFMVGGMHVQCLDAPTSVCPLPTDKEIPSAPEEFKIVEGGVILSGNGTLTCKEGEIFMCLDGIGTSVDSDHLHCHEELKRWKTGFETLNITQKIGCIKKKTDSTPSGHCPFFVNNGCAHLDGFAVAGNVSVCPHGTNATLEGHGPIQNITCPGEPGFLEVGFVNGSLCKNKNFTFICQGPTTTTSTTTSTSTTTTITTEATTITSTTTGEPTTTASTTTAQTTTTSTASTVKPNTGTSTTTVATSTKSDSPYCPPGGVWSEWETIGQCATTCGSCSVAKRRRTCSDNCGSCRCIGDSEDIGPCGISLCAFPANTCCPNYVKSLNIPANSFFCGNGTVPALPSYCRPF